MSVKNSEFALNYKSSKPVCIFYIIIGNTIDLPTDHFLRNILDLFSRNSCINTSGLANRTFQYHRPRRNYTITVNNGIVHYDRTHSYQYIVMQYATMHNCIVTDRNIISNSCTGSFEMYNEYKRRPGYLPYCPCE